MSGFKIEGNFGIISRSVVSVSDSNLNSPEIPEFAPDQGSAKRDSEAGRLELRSRCRDESPEM